MNIHVTILGCGSSGGVPRIGDNWGICNPENSYNRRRRCALLVELEEEGQGITQALVDAGPDIRSQLLDAEIRTLDGVLLTHSHADHIHGIDDLRAVVFNKGAKIDVWTDEQTAQRLKQRFSYIFEQDPDSEYPAILTMNILRGPIKISGKGGCLTAVPFPVRHGDMMALGFRFGPVVYTPDISDMTDDAWRVVKGAQLWIVDALQHKPHRSHAHLKKTLKWIEMSGVDKAILTNMHIDMDYEHVLTETPDYVVPAYDGLKISMVY